LDEIESELSIHLHPLSWPIGMGRDFKGVYNLFDKSLLLFNANQKATEEDYLPLKDLNDDVLQKKIGKKEAEQLREDVELIEGVYGTFDKEPYLQGKVARGIFRKRHK